MKKVGKGCEGTQEGRLKRRVDERRRQNKKRDRWSCEGEGNASRGKKESKAHERSRC